MARRRPESDLNSKTTPARNPGKSKLQLDGATPVRARRSASTSVGSIAEDETAAHPESHDAARPAWLPRVFFLLVMGLFLAVLVIEVKNRVRRPTAWTPSPPAGTPALTFYGKSDGATRTTWIFDEPAGEAGPPRLIQELSHAQLKATGEIRWSADRRAVFATSREVVERGVPVVLWLFEFGTDPSYRSPAGVSGAGPKEEAAEKTTAPAPAGRIYVSHEDLAPRWLTAIKENAAALTARWKQHGGSGPLAASGYDLAIKRPYLYSWQTTRWENALAD